MKPLTEQDVFNNAYIGMLRQNRRSAKSLHGNQCLYRGPNGLKCAIGHSIPDELYSASMENVAFLHIIRPEARFKGSKELRKLFANVSDNLIRELQSIHDTVEVHRWKFHLDNLAVRYKLNIPKTENDNG